MSVPRRKPRPEDFGLTKPEWAKRRRLLYLALAFIAGWLSWIFFKGTDTGLYTQASIALIGAAVALIGQYIFGAMFDDKNYMASVAAMRPKAAADDDSADDPPLSGGR